MASEDVGNTESQYMIVVMFQWQEDKKLVPIYPRNIMEEAGATYTYPPWAGPWDNLN